MAIIPGKTTGVREIRAKTAVHTIARRIRREEGHLRRKCVGGKWHGEKRNEGRRTKRKCIGGKKSGTGKFLWVVF